MNKLNQKHLIKGCIDAITVFDENKRDQTYYKQIIRDSFGGLLKNQCSMVKAFTLENQIPKLSMKFRKLNLNDKKVS